MYKGFKIRIYPTKEQETLFWKHIGACRYIWNYMLDLQEERFKNHERHLSEYDMNYLLKPLKNDGEHAWLYEVSDTSLRRTCRDLQQSYMRLFKGLSKCAGYKTRKKSKQSYPVCCEKFYFCDDKSLQIQKVGMVKYKTDFDIPIGRGVCKFYNVRVSFDDNKWFVGFTMDCENQAPNLTDKVMGIDLGVKEMAVATLGDKPIIYHNINKSAKMKKLVEHSKRLQRSICRKREANRVGKKYRKTNNIAKQEEKLRKIRRRIKNIRNNYIHQVTHELVSMLPRKIVMEDLSVKDMQKYAKKLKRKGLSRQIRESNFYEFRRQVRYKCEYNGIEFVLADRFFASSKTCSRCGNKVVSLPLDVRTYVCEKCGLVIDRDFNAALNLSRYTL